MKSGCASCIGCREFKCIGDKPPQDHPHMYIAETRMVKVISGALYFREAAICGETSTWRARTMKGLLSKLCELDGGLICRRQILELVQPVLL